MITTTLQTHDRVAQLVGNTPLLGSAASSARRPAWSFTRKLSGGVNPSGSVKARAAARIIEEGERSGRLDRGKIILDATSGNTGIAHAFAAAAGYKLRLCVPGNVTLERKRMLRAHGAEVIFTDPMEGSDGAISEARRLFAADPDIYFYADQYNNDANWQAHYDTTAPEIIAQTGGRVTCFVAGLGTSGTFVGTGRRLRRSIRLFDSSPCSLTCRSTGIEGLKHMDTAIVPGIYDAALADDALRVEPNGRRS